jgi:glucokinase
MTQAQTSNLNYIGIDLSGRTIRAALVNVEGHILDRLETALNPETVTDQIAQIAIDLRKAAPEVSTLGIGVPGLVNPRTNKVSVSFDLPSMTVEDLREGLVSSTGLHVELENDANAAAYSEYLLGAGRGFKNMIYVTIGSGIGGAIILNGELWLGASGFAGEIGHITIDPSGIDCVCGNKGCLETIASAPNIVRRTHERLFRDGTSSLSRLAINKDFTAADIAGEARNGDDFAMLMIERTGKFIGTAIATVINLLNVELIILGGDVMQAGDLILEPIIREAGHRSFRPCFEATQITAAQVGSDAVMIGAALLAHKTSLTA